MVNSWQILRCRRLPLSDSSTLLGSKPDVIKEVYASLLKVSLQFARNSVSADAAYDFLKVDCKVEIQRAEQYKEYYGRHLIKLQIVLGNIGNYLPHIVDVKWKIDYVIKVNTRHNNMCNLIYNIKFYKKIFIEESFGSI